MSLVIFIIILIALIWVHELGHFTAAKLFGIRVDEFAIGFPPRLFGVKIGDTEYTFNALLLGGFVRIFGEDEKSAHAPRSMASRSKWVQAAVIVAGVVMNVIFGWLTLSAGYVAGMPATADYSGWGQVTNTRPTIVAVLPDSPAQKAGVVAGDEVLAVQTGHDTLDTRALNTNKQAGVVQQFIANHADQSIVLTVLHNGKEATYLAVPAAGLIAGRKAIGIELDDVGILKLPIHLALVQGATSAYDLTVATAQGLGTFALQALHGAADFSQVSGPVGIAQAGAGAVQRGFAAAATITALISFNLAVINTLPIPGLDGGRLLILAVEGIMRRSVSPRVAAALSLGGLALLIALMILVTVHDISKLVG